MSSGQDIQFPLLLGQWVPRFSIVSDLPLLPSSSPLPHTPFLLSPFPHSLPPLLSSSPLPSPPQSWQSAYMFAMAMLVFVSLFAQAHTDFLSSHWYFRRIVLYSAFIFASVVPVAHWILLSGGFQDPFVQVRAHIFTGLGSCC